METFIFALNAVLPLILIVAIGYFLKKKGFIDTEFAKRANRLVFNFFLPPLLFLNVYKIEDISRVDGGYIVYGVAMLLAGFFVAIPLVMAFTKEAPRRGVLLQASFRSNLAYVGIPVAMSLFGESGSAAASILSAAFIPIYNVLAVVSLSMFNTGGEKPNLKKILTGIAKNPFIRSIFAGFVVLIIRAYFVKYQISFRLSDIEPLFEVMEMLSRIATPLALLTLGAQFEFSAVKELKREIIFGVLARTAVMPLVGIGVAYFAFGDIFSGAHFAAFVAAFTTPLAVSTIPMSQEMGGDAKLAGQLVVWTTILSVVPQFIAALLLKAAGIF